MTSPEPGATLWAISDLHVGYPQNHALLARLAPSSADDWLIVAGDVAERAGVIEQTLAFLAGRFAKVIWTPGNHDLWTSLDDPLPLRGVARYDWLVERCRRLGVVTPEDEFPVWPGPGGPAVVAPLFTLYDFSVHLPQRPGHSDDDIVLTDYALLHADPYPGVVEWCQARVAYSRRRLDRLPDLPIVLVDHYPLIATPLLALSHRGIAPWSATTATADWHRQHRTLAVVYGHLHLPGRAVYDGVRFEEVSVGYPREWSRRPVPPGLRPILPEPDSPGLWRRLRGR